ncbi:ISKra4 family transposase [Sansalvadorimonas verongulae]|uniref:ISKra4 family transposase n=1 Tax=Sansalvadorimonas verongulae TaxID=2172824 RepID=UPI0012BBDED5|nr:ISKra4 family transposase [Sansalvadorimonas verongulae]MTI13988.1 ISKra4 family transposase [Sansalvadorimonas verongulae]
MPAQILASKSQETQILITVQHGQSMLQFEEHLQDELNAAGRLAATRQLEHLDTTGEPIRKGSTRLTCKKKKEPKVYETQWGQVRIDRYVYQSSRGGKIFCPLDQNARIVVNSTPAFARMVSWKYANMVAPQVEDDLLQNHRRTSSRTTLKDLSDVVASIAQAKEESWCYEVPDLPDAVATVSLGLDGTTLLYRDGNYRTAMCGTISLLNSEGDRLHTIYCAAAPEYGKQTFIHRLTGEIKKIKDKFPDATYVGVADGAPDNWTFLEPFVSYKVLDFYHVSEYVADAAEALFPGKKNQSQRKSWLKEKLHCLKHEQGAAKRLSKELQNAVPGNHRTASIEKLHRARTYFKNNWRKMIYFEAREKNLPIGSGVTEAACKILVKQRMCRSGMRWKEEGASMLLTLRALVCSTGYWECFWKKVNQYGFPVAHNLQTQH